MLCFPLSPANFPSFWKLHERDTMSLTGSCCLFFFVASKMFQCKCFYAFSIRFELNHMSAIQLPPFKIYSLTLVCYTYERYNIKRIQQKQQQHQQPARFSCIYIEILKTVNVWMFLSFHSLFFSWNKIATWMNYSRMPWNIHNKKISLQHHGILMALLFLIIWSNMMMCVQMLWIWYFILSLFRLIDWWLSNCFVLLFRMIFLSHNHRVDEHFFHSIPFSSWCAFFVYFFFLNEMF